MSLHTECTSLLCLGGKLFTYFEDARGIWIAEEVEQRGLCIPRKQGIHMCVCAHTHMISIIGQNVQGLWFTAVSLGPGICACFIVGAYKYPLIITDIFNIIIH